MSSLCSGKGNNFIRRYITNRGATAKVSKLKKLLTNPNSVSAHLPIYVIKVIKSRKMKWALHREM